MDYRPSDRLSSHPDHAFRPSSSSNNAHSTHYSFPRQRWAHLNSPSPSAPSSDLPNLVNPGRHETALDETTRAYRTSALRQLNGSSSRPLSWRSRQQAVAAATATSNPSGGRSSSTLASQPVLVRSYSGGPDDHPGTSSKMPSRLSFPFTVGSSTSSNTASSTQRNGPELPLEDEFSIDKILWAIEPNIRHTLDSIGEICGRSKLSLANEYGSHIAPLGEIRAPPGGLLTVEEASPDHERFSGDNVVIYDDENSATDGRDHTSFSHYTFFDTLLPSLTAPPGPQSSGREARTDALRSVATPVPTLESLPTTREFASKPKSDGRALLGTLSEHDILTPALVSEILLDAQGNGHSPPPGHEQSGSGEDNVDLRNMSSADKLSEVQSLFRWLRIAGWNENSGSERQTAEMRLRAMLERQNDAAQ